MNPSVKHEECFLVSLKTGYIPYRSVILNPLLRSTGAYQSPKHQLHLFSRTDGVGVTSYRKTRGEYYSECVTETEVSVLNPLDAMNLAVSVLTWPQGNRYTSSKKLLVVVTLPAHA